MKLSISSITPFTFQDYPGHTACILWFSGCNMRCMYCHNPELVLGKLKSLPLQKVKSFLESRAGLLEGVVLSGGECTLNPSLHEFIKYIKGLGYKVKIDTNGTNPNFLEQLLQQNLVDFIAMDFKAPEEKFKSITKFSDYTSFIRSLEILCKSGVNTEVRTTVYPGILNENDVNNIIKELEKYNFKGVYAIQKFREGENLGKLASPSSKFYPSSLICPSFDLQLRNF